MLYFQKRIMSFLNLECVYGVFLQRRGDKYQKMFVHIFIWERTYV